MLGLKYLNKKWMKKGLICEIIIVFILIYDLWIIYIFNYIVFMNLVNIIL